MLTPFGRLVRKHRIDRTMKLLQMADFLGVTSPFLSAVETGQKPVPKGDFVDRVGECLGLTSDQLAELQEAALASHKIVQIPQPQDARRRELLAVFARRLPEMTDEQLDNVKKSLDIE